MGSRVRAVVSLALVWGLIWGTIGFAIGLGLWMRYVGLEAPVLDLIGGGLAYARSFALQGALWGGVFAVLLGPSERGSSVDELTIARIARIGIVGGAIVGMLGAILSGLVAEVVIAQLAVFAGTGSLLGAATASITLAVAREGKSDLADGLRDISGSSPAPRLTAGD